MNKWSLVNTTTRVTALWLFATRSFSMKTTSAQSVTSGFFCPRLQQPHNPDDSFLPGRSSLQDLWFNAAALWLRLTELHQPKYSSAAAKWSRPGPNPQARSPSRPLIVPARPSAWRFPYWTKPKRSMTLYRWKLVSSQGSTVASFPWNQGERWRRREWQ